MYGCMDITFYYLIIVSSSVVVMRSLKTVLWSIINYLCVYKVLINAERKPQNLIKELEEEETTEVVDFEGKFTKQVSIFSLFVALYRYEKFHFQVLMRSSLRLYVILYVCLATDVLIIWKFAFMIK